MSDLPKPLFHFIRTIDLLLSEVKGVLRKLCTTQGILFSGNWYIRCARTPGGATGVLPMEGARFTTTKNQCGLAKAVRVQHMTEGKKMDGEHAQKALMEITMKKYVWGGRNHRIIFADSWAAPTLRELREWPSHSESVFPETGVVPRLLNKRLSGLTGSGPIPENQI